jgi:hypothetical protein
MEVTVGRERRRKQLLDDLSKREDDTGSCRRKHYIAVCGELTLEEVNGPFVRQTTE